MATYTGTPSTATAGGTITAANWNADVRDVVNALAGAWNTYTPTLSQTGVPSITKTVTYAKYIRVGKFCLGQVRLDATGAGSAGSAITITLPVTAAASALAAGGGIYSDGATVYQGCTAYLVSTTTLVLLRADATGSGAGIGQDPSIAVASGDGFVAWFAYETA